MVGVRSRGAVRRMQLVRTAPSGLEVFEGPERMHVEVSRQKRPDS